MILPYKIFNLAVVTGLILALVWYLKRYKEEK